MTRYIAEWSQRKHNKAAWERKSEAFDTFADARARLDKIWASDLQTIADTMWIRPTDEEEQP